MKQILINWCWTTWLGFEYRYAMVNAYLADCRGDKLARTQHQQQAWTAQRELSILRLNQRYGALR